LAINLISRKASFTYPSAGHIQWRNDLICNGLQAGLGGCLPSEQGYDQANQDGNLDAAHFDFFE
jgi:hypothetical protein